MNITTSTSNRRAFIKASATLATGFLAAGGLNQTWAADGPPPDRSLYEIGPIEGYSPHIGTLVSMLNYNRRTIVNTVKLLSKDEFDVLFDPLANTIGALILHLGAVEKIYQVNTFEGRELNDAEKKIWDAPLKLGEAGRKEIKGHEVGYYLDTIKSVREATLRELKNRDDKWLFTVDPQAKPRVINNYWKWFHVCEHESNHRGQITWLKRRLPGAKAEEG